MARHKYLWQAEIVVEIKRTWDEYYIHTWDNKERQKNPCQMQIIKGLIYV